MEKLTLKNVNVKMPNEFIGSVSEIDIVEWLEFRLGLRSDISLSNPLCDIELSDCVVLVGAVEINGKDIKM